MSTVTFSLPEREQALDDPIVFVCSEGCGEVAAVDIDKHAIGHKASSMRVEWKKIRQ